MRWFVSFIVFFGIISGCTQRTKEVVTERDWLPIPTDRPGGIATPLPEPQDKFLGYRWFEEELNQDAESIPEVDREFTRYIWNNRFNEQVSDQELGRIRDGISLGINSLSSERRLTQPVRFGSSNQIYRINIQDYNISVSEWERIEDELALGVQSLTVRGRNLQFLTQSRVPWVYASDFFKTTFNGKPSKLQKYAHLPGLYYDLTDQPGTNSLYEFLAGVGVNIEDEFDSQDAVCEGGSDSDIAIGKKRMICHFESDDGDIFNSYDTDEGGDNLLLNPFPIEAGSRRVFKHAAQEWIYSLPNGCFGYRLNATADQGGLGEAQGAAPVTVVLNRRAAGLGLSAEIDLLACSGCHNRIKEVRGKLGDHIASPAANFEAIDKRRSLIFHNKTKLNARISRANDNFASGCLQGLAITPFDSDPINNTITDPLRLNQNIQQIAGYFFERPEKFGELLAASEVAGAQIGNLLVDGGVVGFDDFVGSFFDTSEDLNLFRDQDDLSQ